MDHNEAVRLKATERYLLNEFDTEQLDQFEEHLFGCPDCALDLRAAAMFLEQSKTLLSQPVRTPTRVTEPVPARNWLAWFRPAYALPALALLLAVLGYQAFVAIPAMKEASSQPTVLPFATITVATRSATMPVVHGESSRPFMLLLNIPAETRFSSYVVDLYDPAGKIQWSLPVSAEAANDTVPLRIPGLRDSGTYTVAIRGVGQNSSDLTEIGKQPFELRF
ncbi:MAG TPA: zf-HC2 domain-containing protein [Terriglobales bacterium]|nr:zf-HC2 domain-containing protein [Terriglobales bacterium]